MSGRKLNSAEFLFFTKQPVLSQVLSGRARGRMACRRRGADGCGPEEDQPVPWLKNDSFFRAARDVDLQGAPVGEDLQRALLRHARSLVPKRSVFRYADQEVNVLIQLAGLVESMKTLACLRMHIELGW